MSALAEPTSTGAARRRRAQCRRSEARHVSWLFQRFQEAGSHHSKHPPAGSACTVCAASQRRSEVLENRLADLQLQVTELARICTSQGDVAGEVKEEKQENQEPEHENRQFGIVTAVEVGTDMRIPGIGSEMAHDAPDDAQGVAARPQGAPAHCTRTSTASHAYPKSAQCLNFGEPEEPLVKAEFPENAESGSLAGQAELQELEATGAEETLMIGGFRQGQTVYAAKNIIVKGNVVVKMNTPGKIIGPSVNNPMQRIAARFSRREDCMQGTINVATAEIKKVATENKELRTRQVRPSAKEKRFAIPEHQDGILSDSWQSWQEGRMQKYFDLWREVLDG